MNPFEINIEKEGLTEEQVQTYLYTLKGFGYNCFHNCDMDYSYLGIYDGWGGEEELESITLQELNRRLVVEHRKQFDELLKSYSVLERRTPDFGDDD